VKNRFQNLPFKCNLQRYSVCVTGYGAEERAAGLYKLNAVEYDPQLESAAGFKPLNLSSK
jgi:hypothetical protein